MQASIEDVKKVIAFSQLPDEHLQWILDRSEFFEYRDGDLIANMVSPHVMWMALQGKVTF